MEASRKQQTQRQHDIERGEDIEKRIDFQLAQFQVMPNPLTAGFMFDRLLGEADAWGKRTGHPAAPPERLGSQVTTADFGRLRGYVVDHLRTLRQRRQS